MVKFLPILSIMMLACGACAPETEQSADSAAVDPITDIGTAIGPTQIGDDTSSSECEPEPEDPYPWATWETCAHDIGDNPCNFSLMDQHGETVELYEYYGKVIVIDLSAMWCSVCKNIAATGDEWVAKYGAEDFIWLTVLLTDAGNQDPDLQDLQDWATAYGITVPVLAGSRNMIDLTDPLEDGYPVTSWPTLVVVDRNMVLQHGLNGWNEATISGWVDGLL